jgi:hypothetical protein
MDKTLQVTEKNNTHGSAEAKRNMPLVPSYNLLAVVIPQFDFREASGCSGISAHDFSEQPPFSLGEDKARNV